MAWAFENFEYFSGGRNTHGVRIQTETSDIWALRSDDPDKTVPRRVWTTEVTIALLADQLARFGVRLLVSTPEAELDIEPHSPGFVRQVAENCGLLRGAYSIDAEPWIIRNVGDFDRLVEKLVDPERPVPFFVLSVAEGAPEETPAVDPVTLAHAVIGLAQVVILPNEFTWRLTDQFGMTRSVFGGAVRAYLPGFSGTANPYDHRLILPKQVSTPRGSAQASRWMRSLAARESVRRSALGRDTLAFSAIRSAALQLEQQRLASAGASESDLLVAATAQISALEKQLTEERAAQDYYVSEHDKAEERAIAAEEQLRASAYRIQELLERVQGAGEAIDDPRNVPHTWEDFNNWVDVSLSGRVSLTPAARRQTRLPQFEMYNWLLDV